MGLNPKLNELKLIKAETIYFAFQVSDSIEGALANGYEHFNRKPLLDCLGAQKKCSNFAFSFRRFLEFFNCRSI